MGNKNRQPFSNKYWQSAAINNQAVLMYQDWIKQLCMNRFNWVGLPDSCDIRYLEQTLLMDGKATIASPVKKDSEGNLLPKVFYSLKVAEQGDLNMYGLPVNWGALGENGKTHFSVSASSGVIIYDNSLRTSSWNVIQYYATMLANTDKAYRVNLNQQQKPWLIQGDSSLLADMKNAYKQIDGGEPAIIATKQFTDLMDIKAIDTRVEFIGQELQMSKSDLWAEIFNYLGIDSLMRKSERMIEDEVNAENQPTSIMALSALRSRRDACKQLNDRFGLDVHVYWNTDYISDNFNIINNVEAQMELGE